MTRKLKRSQRRLGRLLVWLLTRAGLWYAKLVPGFRSRQSKPAPRRSMVFESLEPRPLLSADLLPVALDTAQPADDSAHVSVIVRNAGDTLPARPCKNATRYWIQRDAWRPLN